jgi:hypothetical protein
VDRTAVLRRIDAMEQMLQDLRSDVLADDALSDEVVQVPGQGPWRRSMLAELYPHVEHLRGVVALFDMLAERTPDVATYHEVMGKTGLADRQQRSEHAALTRVSVKLFGKRTWPIAWRQASDGTIQYWMPTRLADWWRELRKGSSA